MPKREKKKKKVRIRIRIRCRAHHNFAGIVFFPGSYYAPQHARGGAGFFPFSLSRLRTTTRMAWCSKKAFYQSFFFFFMFQSPSRSVTPFLWWIRYRGSRKIVPIFVSLKWVLKIFRKNGRCSMRTRCFFRGPVLRLKWHFFNSIRYTMFFLFQIECQSCVEKRNMRVSVEC